MNRTIFTRYVVPFLQWYGLMIAVTITADYILHRLQLVWVGRYLGYVGTAVILISFVYSLRKHKVIAYGSPKKLLAIHEYTAWAGSVLILVHAGVHFNAILPWVAILMLLLAVASGLIGKFLLKKSNETLKEKRNLLLKSGMTAEEADKKLFFDAITVDLMKKWRVVHLPVTLILGVLSLLHILSVFFFTR